MTGAGAAPWEHQAECRVGERDARKVTEVRAEPGLRDEKSS